MNCIIITSARFQDLASFHPERRIADFNTSTWQRLFRIISFDIEVVLMYLFDIGFVLHDNEVRLKNKDDVLDFSLGKDKLMRMALAMNLVGDILYINRILAENNLLSKITENPKLDFYRDVLKESYGLELNLTSSDISQLDYLYSLTMHDSTYMLKFREKYQSSLKYKVHETHEKIKEIFDSFSLLRKVLKM